VTHPARYSQDILDVLRDDVLRDFEGTVLDPFGGTGLISKLGHPFVSVDIDKWEGTCSVIADSCTHLPFKSGVFDAVVTSPCYGNRMADHHDARDASHRNTYKHKLGRDPYAGSTAVVQWGHTYRMMHRNAWREVYRVLIDGGLFVLNIKDHYRKGDRQAVAGWHINTLVHVLGFTIHDVVPVGTKGVPDGANATLRTDAELLVIFTK
jgi:tRNA G10  N-methylase Trm11